jgi:hypothetical protein
MSDFYALLIGIDHYDDPNPYFRDLRGTVQDIDLVAGYLEKLNIPGIQITRLTSPIPDTNSLADVRSARQEMPPTYQNIVNAFKDITEKANSGDIVYIHYSGHGGRAKTIYPDLKGEDQPDESIVPMDYFSGGRYLMDVELAMLLRRMRDKGLLVTLVLDSCHSGGATRGDDVAIRGNGEVNPKPPMVKSLVAEEEELINNWRELTEGVAPGSILGSWLPQPKDRARDYVLLAACRPNEYAHEYTIDGKQRHGALTYWMINTLSTSRPGLTYKSLHDRVSAKIQSKFSNQMPMLMGEVDRVVFGSDRIQLQYAVNVMEVIEDSKSSELGHEKLVRVRLNTGMAGGVGIGARFAIYPPGTIDFRKKEQQLAIIEISEFSEVSASDSWADVVEVIRQCKIEQGCQAVMIAPPIDLIRGVRLSKKIVGDRDDQLPQELVDKQDNALKAIEAALVDCGWLRLADNQQKEDYLVAVNKEGEYEICNGLPIENLHPGLKIDDAEASAKLIKRLVHLAKYQAVQELSNQDSPLTEQLKVELLTQLNWRPGIAKNPQPFADSTNIVVQYGGYVFLRIKNESTQILNISVLDLDPEWAITCPQLYNTEEIYYVFNPNQELILPLRPGLPATINKGKEIYKVFATIRDNDFRWLELPPLNEEIGKRSAELKRGDNPLGNLLAAMGADVKEKPFITRASTPIFDPTQEWITKEVQFTLVR